MPKPHRDKNESDTQYKNNKERYEQEAVMPVRSTKELSDTNKKMKIEWKGGKPQTLNEEGKEFFDFVLKRTVYSEL